MTDHPRVILSAASRSPLVILSDWRPSWSEESARSSSAWRSIRPLLDPSVASTAAVPTSRPGSSAPFGGKTHQSEPAFHTDVVDRVVAQRIILLCQAFEFVDEATHARALVEPLRPPDESREGTPRLEPLDRGSKLVLVVAHEDTPFLCRMREMYLVGLTLVEGVDRAFDVPAT